MMHWQEDNYCNSPTLTSEGCSNLVDCLFNCTKKFKNSIAQIDYKTGKTITFNEIKTKTLKAAYRLHVNFEIKTGDIVTICSPNNINYCWQILAVLSTGASCSLVTPTATFRELIHNLSITKPKAVFAQNLNNDQLKVLQETESIKYIWIEENVPSGTKCRSLQELTEDPIELTDKQWTGLCPALTTDPAFILSSSGSTGLPKGVILSHNNFITVLSQSGLFMRFACTAMGLMPFYHAYGLGLMLMALYEGAKLIVLPKFTLEIFLDVIISEKVSHLHIVPSLMTTLAKSVEVTSEKLQSVQKVFTGAGGVITKHQRALLSKLSGSAKLYHSYGMTETTFVVLFGESRFDKPGSAGKLLPGISAKIISGSGEELKGETGELCLKGIVTMSGYLDNPEATSNAFDEYHWLRTGDLAYCDSDGYYYIVDRIKEMIKFQGFQISPTELELVLLTHAGVNEVAVIGKPHELYGEVPKAYVVRTIQDQSVTEEDLQNLIKNELSPYKQLRGGVIFVDKLPNSPTGKIQKKYLKALND